MLSNAVAMCHHTPPLGVDELSGDEVPLESVVVVGDVARWNWEGEEAFQVYV